MSNVIPSGWWVKPASTSSSNTVSTIVPQGSSCSGCYAAVKEYDETGGIGSCRNPIAEGYAIKMSPGACQYCGVQCGLF